MSVWFLSCLLVHAMSLCWQSFFSRTLCPACWTQSFPWWCYLIQFPCFRHLLDNEAQISYEDVFFYVLGQWFSTWGGFCSQGTLGVIWRHLFRASWEGCFRLLVGGVHLCCYLAVDGTTSQQRILQPQISVALQLRNHDLNLSHFPSEYPTDTPNWTFTKIHCYLSLHFPA